MSSADSTSVTNPGLGRQPAVASGRLPRRLAVAAALRCCALAAVCATGAVAAAAEPPKSGTAAPQAVSAAGEYLLATGDVVRVAVFQNPELTLEARVAEDGTINYPLIGAVPVAGSELPAVEKLIAQKLRDGGFVIAPQVTVTLMQVRGNQVTVLGQVGKPGRYPLESTDARLVDVLALAGGITPNGADTVVLTGVRDGKPMRREIDVQSLAAAGDPSSEFRLRGGDMLFVDRAPSFYIYGEVQRPGMFRLERGMTVRQAIASGGGLSPKGTQRGLRIHRKGGDGKVQIIEVKLDDPIFPDDVLYVRESLF